MSAEHTAGPYAVFADERNILVSTQDGQCRLARLYAANGDDLANAHLFSASPEILRMLEIAVGVIDASGIVWLGADQARAAIAKAKGGA